MIPVRTILAWSLAGLLLTAGCAGRRPTELLPTYPRLDDAAALKVLAERAAAVKSLSAQCNITLTRPAGDSVRLDGAVVMAPPDRLRMRAWKFNQAIFDLTLTPEGLWVMTPDDPARREKVLPAGLSAARFGREWALLNGQFFTHPDLTLGGNDRWLTVSRTLDDGRKVVCRIDRPTLTPRRYVMSDPQGVVRFELTLSDYHLVNNIPWPQKTRAVSDEGTIDLRLKEVELNQDLAPSAFKPPRRAEKRG
jgi:outer membrane lipoprotein-sorting protein